MRWLSFCCFFLLLVLGFVVQIVPLSTVKAAPATDDMISPISDPSSCITVSGVLTATPTIASQVCRGLSSQLWMPDGSGKWHSGVDANYCLARQTTSSWTLTVYSCTDTRVVQLQADSGNPQVYVVISTTLALDNYGSTVGLYPKNGGNNQQWRWLQDDLAVVNGQGCAISYPFPASDTATYQRELACDRVAKIQPPYVIPAAAIRNPNVFPGTVPTNALAVTQNFTFNLAFKDHSYLRVAAPPQNWQGTGLYAPPNQIIQVTVNNATAAELSDVYVQLGVHTDVLAPTSGNVSGGNFLRNPSIVVRIGLLPGENLVRNPYGGPILLVSRRSQNKILDLTIANAIQAPYFVAGQTSEAEWLSRRTADAPFAEIEGERAVIHVPSSEVRTLSYADVLATARYYSTMVEYHNALAGLSDTAALPHQSPQGKHRHVEDIQISLGWGHSGFPAMYFTAWQIGVPEESVYRSNGWGVYHELGHNHQMGAWSYIYGTEVTVNLWSLYAQEQFFGNSRLVDENSYATAIARLGNPTIVDKWGSADPFGQLVFLDQIRLGFPQLNWSIWTQLMQRYREMSASDYNALSADQQKRDKFLEILCDITNTNLTPHWDAWTIPVSQPTRDYCATKPALSQPIWLIDGAQPQHTGAGSGRFLREVWNDISGAALTALTSNPAYPTTPSQTSYISGPLEGTQSVGDNYGTRLRAWLLPPVTGNYRFWLAGDDAAQVRVSSDADALHARTILTLTTSTSYREFDRYNSAIQRSLPISLTAGQSYYIEVLHKEAGGSDHVSVAWDIPADASAPFEARKVIDGRFLSPYLGDLALRNRLAAHQPSTVVPGSDVTFTLELFNQGIVTAQQIHIVDTLPTGFTLSPANNPGWMTGYRYVRLVALSEAGNRGPWASMAELGVLGPNQQPLDKTNWRIAAVDSENPDSPAHNAIDNDTSTIWHTMWWSNPPPYPHSIEVDLGSLYSLTGFTYLPRQSSVNGRIGQYRFEVSVDGLQWVQAAAGQFPDNAQLQTVTFNLPPPQLAFLTLPGSLTPQAVQTANIILRASPTITSALYTNVAELFSVRDATGALLYDADSTPDADPNNDPQVDDEINNAQRDEDDQDGAVIQVALVAPPVVNPGYALSLEMQRPNPIRLGDTLGFVIHITNTGNVTITTLPLTDTYDSHYLALLNATPASIDAINDGRLDWPDLVSSFGHPLAPNAHFDLAITFRALADTTRLPGGQTTNQANGHDVFATVPDLAVSAAIPAETQANAGQIPVPNPPTVASAPIQIYASTSALIASSAVTPGSDGIHLQWTTAMESELLGFFILRQDEGGVWQMLNQEMIAAQRAGQNQGAAYHWVDASPPPSLHLRYTLKLVITSGEMIYHDLGEIAVGHPLYLPQIQR